MKKLLASYALIAVVTVGSANFAQAQNTAPAPSPVNSLDQRIDNQDNHTTSGVKGGAINAQQEGNDNKLDSKVSGEMTKDEAAHNGTVTKSEDKHMNKQLSRDSKRIHKQRSGAKKPATTAAPAQ